jgi:anti-anti-sigma regulatory factor
VTAAGGVPDDFTLDLIAAGPVTQVVAPGSAVALHEARQLERRVIEGIGHGRTRVILDLSDVTAVGPGLLGALLRIRRGVSRVDGRMALVVAGPPMSDLVEATLLGVLVDVEPDREHALARLTGAAIT